MEAKHEQMYVQTFFKTVMSINRQRILVSDLVLLSLGLQRQLHSAHRLRLTQQELLAVLQSPHDFLCTIQRSTVKWFSVTLLVPFEIMKSSHNVIEFTVVVPIS